MSPSSARRARFVALALGTIVLGLAVHLAGGALGPAVRDVLGDALWGAMIAWWIGALAPRVPRATRGAWAYATCVAVECSQLYHTPALDAVRETRLGHLVLGSGFDARDLLAYALGVAVATWLEGTLIPNTRAPDAARSSSASPSP